MRRQALVAAAWPDGAIVHDNTLDAYLARIRRKLRDVGVAEAHRHGARRRLPAAMSFRGRLLLPRCSTLAVGLGALLVVGNAPAGARATPSRPSLLRARARTPRSRRSP